MESKITIVFLHGLLSDKSYGLLLTKPLEDFINVKAFDLPGHNGVSIGGIKDFSGFSSVVNDFVNRNVEGKYIIVGFSFGGVVALEYHNSNYEDLNYLGCLIWASPVNGFLTFVSNVFHYTFKHFIPTFLFDFIKSNKLIQKMLSKYGINIEFSTKHELLQILDIINFHHFNLVKTEKKAIFVFHSNDLIVSIKNRKSIPIGSQVNIINNLGHLPSAKCINEVCNIIKNNFILK